MAERGGRYPSLGGRKRDDHSGGRQQPLKAFWGYVRAGRGLFVMAAAEAVIGCNMMSRTILRQLAGETETAASARGH